MARGRSAARASRRTSYKVNLSADGAFRTCQDSTCHPGEECKHSLAAVMLSRALVGLEQHNVFDQPEPTLIHNGSTAWSTVDDSDYRAERDVFARLGHVLTVGAPASCRASSARRATRGC